MMIYSSSPTQYFRLRPLALQNVVLTAGLCLRVVLGLLASLEPRHNAVIQLTLDDRPADAAPAAVELCVDAGDGEAAGGFNEAPKVLCTP